MRHRFKALLVISSFVGIFSYNSRAQQSVTGTTTSTNRTDEIVIRKKGDKDSKVTVEFKDGQITVNGKPLTDYDNDDISVSRRRSVNIARAATPASPFRGGTYNFDYNQDQKSYPDGQAHTYTTTTSNKALLGVMSEKDENGAKITSVTKNSAAEKASLKEGDVTTKVDNTTITAPDELSKAIGKYKPEDKVTIAYRRDKKEQRTTVTLAKRQDAGAFSLDGFSTQDFNFDMLTPGQNGNFSTLIRGDNLRLGLKAQDTEEGKGVKVLDVDDGSNAAKAGIKEGDVIMEFDGDRIDNVTDLMNAAKDMREKISVKVKLNREGKTQEMEIRVPKRLKTATL